MRNKQTGMAKSLTCILAMLGVILTPILASASPLTIDFDPPSLSGMSNSPGNPVPLSNQLSNQLQPTYGAVFSSAAGYVAVVDLGLGHAISSPNGIGGVNALGNLSYGTPITVSFFDPTNALVKAVTNFVEIRGDQKATFPLGTATLTAFGIGGGFLGTFTAPDVAGGLTLSLSVPGIHSVRISETSATIAFDNLKFNPVTSVPEPASLMLLGAGLAAIGIWRRKVAKG
jgi:hypothetical protein